MSRAYRGESAQAAALGEYEKGMRMLSDADAWIERNPTAWAYMTEQARRSAANHVRFGIGALAEVVRWHMRNVKGDKGFKLNNDYRSAFARRLVKENPEVEPYIEMRSSCVDFCEEEICA